MSIVQEQGERAYPEGAATRTKYCTAARREMYRKDSGGAKLSKPLADEAREIRLEKVIYPIYICRKGLIPS